jgi:CubicO group peptidase (beta-lactamase class C family)
MRISAEGLQAAGRLVLENGRLRFRRLVSAGAMIEARQGSPSNPAYGLGFWLNANAGRPGAREGDIEEALRSPPDWSRFCLSRDLPADLIAMAGSGGQRVYVIPSRRTVIVRLGTGRAFRDCEFLARIARGQHQP